jgi:enoyl-CoA hydratase
VESPVIARTDGAVGFLRLNRPERRNALTPPMLEFIEQQTAAWEGDASVGVLVIEAGGSAFCAGADIEFLSTVDEPRMRAWELLGNRVLDRIENSRLISIASLNGPAMGGGLTVAAACDFRMAAAHASFAQPEIELGWVPGWNGVRRLARSAGAHWAKRLSLTGERIGSERAQQIGFVDRVIAAEQLAAATLDFARGIAAAGPAASAVKLLADGGPAMAHHFDALVNSSLLHSEKGKLMIRKFLEKRSTANV